MKIFMKNVKIPYGEADFKTLREENFIYVDKTEYIKKLENYKKVGDFLWTIMMY